MLVCCSLLRVRLARSAAACKLTSAIGIGARVAAMLLDELRGYMVDDAIVPVLAAQTHIALDGQRLETPG